MGDQITEPESAEEQTPQEEEQEETPVVEEEEETGMTPGLQELYKEANIPIEGEEATDEQEPEGEEEETPAEEGDGEKYSKRVQTRINKATKSLREEERKSKALEEKVAELEAKAIQPQEPPAPTEQEQSKTKMDELGVKLAELKKERKQARSDFDDDKLDDLEDKIDDVKEQIFAEKYKKPTIDQEKLNQAAEESALRASEKVALDDFSAKNDWFRVYNDDGKANLKYKNIKAIRAVEISKEIGPTFKGTPHEFYSTLEKQIATEFPEGKPKKKFSAVGGVTPNTATHNTEHAALDEVQREIAHGAFPEMSNRAAEKEYAKINQQYGKRSA